MMTVGSDTPSGTELPAEPPDDITDEIDTDCFQGAAPIKTLSARLAIGDDDFVTDQMIVDIMGEEVLEPFRYAQETLRGHCRRTTNEPAFCHSADIALRALDLSYSPHVLNCCLLHDTVEDTCKTLAQASAQFRVIATRFGSEVERDVRLLTNRCKIITDSLAGRLPKDLPFENESLRYIRTALEQSRSELSDELRKEFRPEYDDLLDFGLAQAEISGGAKKARLDRKYTILSELALQLYRIYIVRINDDALTRHSGPGYGFHEHALVVKCLDLVDNLRTCDIVNLTALEKILVKAQTVLDTSFYLHDYIYRHGIPTTFIMIYDYLKFNLMQQLAERKKALSFLGDTRFAYLAWYLMKQISGIQEKYKVLHPPVSELRRLRKKIRDANAWHRLLPESFPVSRFSR